MGTGTGIGTLMPTWPTSMSSWKRRAAAPLWVKIAVPLPFRLALMKLDRLVDVLGRDQRSAPDRTPPGRRSPCRGARPKMVGPMSCPARSRAPAAGGRRARASRHRRRRARSATRCARARPQEITRPTSVPGSVPALTEASWPWRPDRESSSAPRRPAARPTAPCGAGRRRRRQRPRSR